jgi:hypothetical protein
MAFGERGKRIRYGKWAVRSRLKRRSLARSSKMLLFTFFRVRDVDGERFTAASTAKRDNTREAL